MPRVPIAITSFRSGLRTRARRVSIASPLLLSPLLLVGLSGCNYASTLVERSVTLEVPLAADAPLAVQAENGSISVTESTGQTMTINAVIRARTQERADATSIVAEPSPEGGVTLFAQWPDKRQSNEKCSFVITAPALAAVNLRSTNGSITLKGFDGQATARSSNGAISISDFTGPITAHTSNGAIKITDATASVNADTSNGAITVALSDANAGPVTLKTSNGSIDLAVGEAFAGSLGASTSNGSVTISGPGVQVTQQARNAATVTFGGQAAATAASSSIRTTNGRITVRGSN